MFSRRFLSMKFLMLMMLGLLSSSLVQAQQMIAVQEGVEVKATLSSKASNRIAVQNDRILSVKGTQGEFELDKDSELGQVFVKPIPKESQEPIHIFLSTETGKTYALALLSQDTPAQSIVLMPPGLSLVPWEQAGTYEASIKTLIKAMHTQSEVEGFAIERLNIKLPSIQGAVVVALQAYTGHLFTAEVLELHNTTKQSLNFDEMDFYGEGVRAITLVEKTLPPSTKTRVYRVRS